MLLGFRRIEAIEVPIGILVEIQPIPRFLKQSGVDPSWNVESGHLFRMIYGLLLRIVSPVEVVSERVDVLPVVGYGIQVVRQTGKSVADLSRVTRLERFIFEAPHLIGFEEERFCVYRYSCIYRI